MLASSPKARAPEGSHPREWATDENPPGEPGDVQHHPDSAPPPDTGGHVHGPPMSPAWHWFWPMGAERSPRITRRLKQLTSQPARPPMGSPLHPGACGSACQDSRAVLSLGPGSLSRSVGDCFLIFAQISCDLCKSCEKKKCTYVGLSQRAGLFVTDPELGRP